MIDVIIPAFNAHKTIRKTLISIEMQSLANNINVYIIDDASEEDYEYLKDIFKNTLNINIIRNNKNLGPGISRQKALDNSNSEYIVFIDADDVFYDIYSIENLYNNIGKSDTIWGVVLEQESENEFTFARARDTYLHGKMYRRSFIEKNNLKFCNSRNHEDNAFNVLYESCANDIKIIENPVYVYTKNETSITHNTSDSETIRSFINVYEWLLKEEIKRKIDNEIIATHIYVVILYVYFNYFKIKKDEDVDFVFKELKPIVELYNKYDILDEYTKISIHNDLNMDIIPSMSVEEFLKNIE